MSLYQQWTLAQANSLIRRELMDPNGQWWPDTFLNQEIANWQNELQMEYELTWGTSTVLTTNSGASYDTIPLGTIMPQMERLEAVYWGTGTSSGFRLAGRLLEDLDRGNPMWRSALPDTPREIIQYDSTTAIVWPCFNGTSTYIFEYPQRLSVVNGTDTLGLPIWAQWSVKPYVCARAYLRPGPTNDVQKSLRYAKLYQQEKEKIRKLWDNWLPERYRKLKPAGHYEWNIAHPPPAWSTS